MQRGMQLVAAGQTSANVRVRASASRDGGLARHNTQAVTEKGVPIDRDRQGAQLMGPKQFNVSHVFSQFLMDEVDAARAQESR